MGFDLSEYEPVAVRLQRWIESCLARGVQHRVETELVHYLADVAVFRTALYENDVMIATGWEEETRGSSPVNRTSHLANAETGSVGRALANAGYAGSDPSKRPSREEMAKVARSEQPRQQGPKTITNKMRGKCTRCGAPVEVGEGIAVNDGNGWKTYHNDGQCPTEEPF